MEPNQQDLLRLHLTPGLGRVTLFKLLRHFGDFTAPLHAPPQHWQAAGVTDNLYRKVMSENDPYYQKVLHKLEALKVQVVGFNDDSYPPLLREIHDPPAILYVRGKLPTNDCLAIVGSRRATPPGLSLTRNLAATLARHNICIVSGLARGVDSAAHYGALDVNGATIAVLGCGIDRVYPPDKSKIFDTFLCCDNIRVSTRGTTSCRSFSRA